MRVSLVAMTTVLPRSLPIAGWMPTQDEKAYAVNDADLLAEFAGRLCYQSWTRPNPATARNDGYVANIIQQQHFSVMEHASFSFYVDGVSRSLLAELTRHRHLSFSVLSQRYVDESDAEMITPPAISATLEEWNHAAGWDGPALLSHLNATFTTAREVYEILYKRLIGAGLTKKQAREAARSVLPNATETKFIVTGNVRAWREVVAKRNHPGADAEIRTLARDVLRVLKLVAPNCFQDMEVDCDDCNEGAK